LNFSHQAVRQFRRHPEHIENRSQPGANRIPVGTLVTIEPAVGASLISLYNLYGYDRGRASGSADRRHHEAHGKDRGRARWASASDGPRCQSGEAGRQSDVRGVRPGAGVCLVVAGQYESWYAPATVILAVPPSLVGPVAMPTGLTMTSMFRSGLFR
jgi:hydrophobic/amphiphilic exporter-1 (mainly G- bacteria), HAE1 family